MRYVTPLLAVASLLVITLAPSAFAHATYPSDDGKFLITVGNQGEPVYTFMVTGLDLIIRENTTQRTEVPGANATLNASIIGPGGQELPCALETQHGAVGRYSCSEGIVYTQEGLYKLRLSGTINGTTVEGDYNMPHVIHHQGGIMFPDTGLPTLKQLNDRIAQLETRIGELENGKLDTNGTPDETGESPAPTLALGAALVGLAALTLRRRR